MIDEVWLPRIDLERCIACGQCVACCPVGALGQIDGHPFLLFPEACTYSAICETLCPVNAIELPYQIRLADPESDSAQANPYE